MGGYLRANACLLLLLLQGLHPALLQDLSPSPGPPQDQDQDPAPSPGPPQDQDPAPSPGLPQDQNQDPAPSPSPPQDQNQDPAPSPGPPQDQDPSPGPPQDQDPAPSPGPTLDQDPPPSPEPTLDPSWLREGQQENEDADQNGMEPTDDPGITDSILITTGEYDNIQEPDVHRTDVTIVTTILPDLSTDTAESAESTVTTAAHTTVLLDATQTINLATESQYPITDLPDDTSVLLDATQTTNVAIESQYSTTALPGDTTQLFIQGSVETLSNDAHLPEPTTSATEINMTEEVTPKIKIDSSIANWTVDYVNSTTSEEPEFVSSTDGFTTNLPFRTTAFEAFPEDETEAPSTTEIINSTDMIPAPGSNSERGFATDVRENKRNAAWGAILGTAVAVAFVGIAVSVVLKKRGQRDFVHRKLVEFPSDPVLRLDNSDPLDLKYDGSAYYNPGLQMDDIQMANFPQERGH